MIRAALALALLAAPAAAQNDADADRQAFIEANVLEMFYHELGHALIDVLELPVLGREEDAADTLSTLLIHDIWEEETATAMVYNTAYAWEIYALEAEEEGGDLPYWDTHALDLQRYYNHVCLFYGAAPDERAQMATDLELPDDRAATCPGEYDLAAASWGAMLADMGPATARNGLRLRSPRKGDPISNLLAQEVLDLNAIYGLPERVSVVIDSCGEANAFYESDLRLITICREYVDDLGRIWDSYD